MQIRGLPRCFCLTEACLRNRSEFLIGAGVSSAQGQRGVGASIKACGIGLFCPICVGVSGSGGSVSRHLVSDWLALALDRGVLKGFSYLIGFDVQLGGASRFLVSAWCWCSAEWRVSLRVSLLYGVVFGRGVLIRFFSFSN